MPKRNQPIFGLTLHRREMYKTIKDVYREMLSSLTTPRSLPNLIKNIDRFRPTFADFDPFLVLEGLGKLEINLLLEKVRPNDANSTEKLWKQFARGAIDSARVLSFYSDPVNLSPDVFFSFVDSSIQSLDDCWAFAQALGEGIHGMGTVVALNFLKEIGVRVAVKPDSQLNEIFSAIRLVPKSTKTAGEKPYRTFLVAQRIAKVNSFEPFLVDKLFWIMGSGKWDNSIKQKLSPLKAKYASRVKEEILPRFSDLHAKTTEGER